MIQGRKRLIKSLNKSTKLKTKIDAFEYKNMHLPQLQLRLIRIKSNCYIHIYLNLETSIIAHIILINGQTLLELPAKSKIFSSSNILIKECIYAYVCK